MRKVLPYQKLLTLIIHKKCRTQHNIDFVALGSGLSQEDTVYLPAWKALKLFLHIVQVVRNIMVIVCLDCDVIVSSDCCLQVKHCWSVLEGLVIV